MKQWVMFVLWTGLAAAVLGCAGRSAEVRKEATRQTQQATWQNLADSKRALALEFANSLTGEQLRVANQCAEGVPAGEAIPIKAGKGLGFSQLTSRQQEVLKQLWQVDDDDIAADYSDPAKAAEFFEKRPQPGPWEDAEVFRVGYWQGPVGETPQPCTDLVLDIQRARLPEGGGVTKGIRVHWYQTDQPALSASLLAGGINFVETKQLGHGEPPAAN